MKTIIPILGVVLALPLAVPSEATAQKPSEPPQQEPTYPHRGQPPDPWKSPPILGRVGIGEPAPDFELDGSRGRPVKLSSLRGSWVVLAFADRWREHKRLDSVRTAVGSLRARIVGVCHEKPQTVVSRAERDSLTFLLLADPTGQVSAMYGLYDHTRSRTLPGFLVVDPEGILRLAVLGQSVPPDEIDRLVRFAITGS